MLYIHTWHNDLYLGSVPLTAVEADGIAPDLLENVDPDGQLLENGTHTFVDFEGCVVRMELKGAA